MHSNNNNGDETGLGERDSIDEESFSKLAATMSDEELPEWIQRWHKIAQYILEMH